MAAATCRAHVRTMPVTPARALRDHERAEAEREKGRLENEAKYTEFRLACEAGDANACCSLGEWFSLLRSDFVVGKQLYAYACEQHNHAQACLNLGRLLGRGEVGVPRSSWNAFQALRQACVAGKEDGCHEAARVLFQAGAPSVVPSPPAAAVGTVDHSSSTSPSPAGSAGAVDDDEGSRVAWASTFPTPIAFATEAQRLLRHGCDRAGGAAASAECCGVLAQSYLTRSYGPWMEAVAPCQLTTHHAAGGGSSGGDGSGVASTTTTSPCLDLLTRACHGEHVSSCTLLAKLHGAPDGYRPWGIGHDVEAARQWDHRGMKYAGMPQRQLDRVLREKYGDLGALPAMPSGASKLT